MNTTDFCKCLLASAVAVGVVILASKTSPEHAGEVLNHAIDALQEVVSRRLGDH